MLSFNEVLKEISEQPLVKDSVNPHFKNRYASLDACQNVVLPILYANGFELVNYTVIHDGVLVLYTDVYVANKTEDTNVRPYIMRSAFPVGAITEKAQQLGSGITYARRYNLCALFSLTADDDDDGNAAQGSPAPRETLAANEKADVKPRSSRFRTIS